MFSIVAFGLTAERKGRLFASLRAGFLTVASLSALAPGIILQFAEPWDYGRINVNSHGRRAQVLAIVIEGLLEAGPQATGLVLILIGVLLWEIVPFLWRTAHRRCEPET